MFHTQDNRLEISSTKVCHCFEWLSQEMPGEMRASWQLSPHSAFGLMLHPWMLTCSDSWAALRPWEWQTKPLEESPCKQASRKAQSGRAYQEGLGAQKYVVKPILLGKYHFFLVSFSEWECNSIFEGLVGGTFGKNGGVWQKRGLSAKHVLSTNRTFC